MITKLTEVRDYFSDRLSNMVDVKYSSADEYEMSALRSTINTLNTEITFLNIEARLKESEELNILPSGYRVVKEISADKILVEMDLKYMHMDCVDSIVYKGKKYCYGAIHPTNGVKIHREYIRTKR